MSIHRLFIAVAIVLGLMAPHTALAQSVSRPPKPVATTASVPVAASPPKVSKSDTMSEWCKGGQAISEGQGSFVSLSAFKPEAGVVKTIYLVPDSVAPTLAYTDSVAVEKWAKANVSEDVPPFEVEPSGSVDDYLSKTMLVPSGGYTVVWDSMLVGWLAAVPNTKETPVRYLSMAYDEDDGMDTFVCVGVDENGKPMTDSSSSVTSTLKVGVPPAGGIFDGHQLSYQGKAVGPVMRAAISFSQQSAGMKYGWGVLFLLIITSALVVWLGIKRRIELAAVANAKRTR